ncbi:transposase [Caldimonas brevitalea]
MVVEECLRPGVSIAAVALAHGLNANMLRKWVTDAQHAEPRMAKVEPPQLDRPQVSPAFVPLALTAPVAEGEIRIELQRTGTTVNIVWPAAAARECAAWLRDWLR